MNLSAILTTHRCFDETVLTRIRRVDVLLAAMVSLLLTGIVFFLIPLSESNPVQQYASFAKQPFSFMEFPYGARMATPVIVGLLPWDIDTGFRIVAFGSFFLCGTLLILWLRLAGVSLRWGLTLLPVFYFASTAKFIIANAWYIDPMSYWVLVMTFIGMMTGNIGITMASLALGALNRPESLTILLPLSIAWWDRDRKLSSLITIGYAIFPAIFLTLAMRYIWPLVSDYQIWAQLGEVNLSKDPQPYSVIFCQQCFKALLHHSIYRETLPCLWGLAAIGFIQTTWRIRWIMILQILLAISPMILATDYFRLPFYVFPALILLSGLGLQALSRIHLACAGGTVAGIWLLTAAAPQSLWLGILFGTLLVFIYMVLAKTHTLPGNPDPSSIE